MTDATPPSKTPSVALGVGISVALGLAVAFGVSSATGPVQAALGGLVCLVTLVAPMAAVWHYTTTHAVTMLAGPGAGLGAVVGAVGSGVSGALGLLLQTVGVLPTQAEQMERQREQLLSDGMDPAQVEQAMQMAEMFGGGNPLVGIALGVLLGAVLGALGGALGAVLFKKGPLEG